MKVTAKKKSSRPTTRPATGAPAPTLTRSRIARPSPLETHPARALRGGRIAGYFWLEERGASHFGLGVFSIFNKSPPSE